MLDDIDVLRRMYATVCGASDEALTLLEDGNIWTAKEKLRQGLHLAEELYIAGEAAVDELEKYRTR